MRSITPRSCAITRWPRPSQSTSSELGHCLAMASAFSHSTASSSIECSTSVSIGLATYLGKMLLLSVAIVVVETTNAKMRLFRVPELLSVAFVLAALALISTFLF